jgi:phenylpyruvate tautomerase PptA (4-oxalocrotonate tautomerase family)
MPMVDARITVSLEPDQNARVHSELTNAAAAALGKPAMYVMADVADGADLWMGGKKLERGAYIHLRSFGSISRSSAEKFAKKATDFLSSELGLDPAGIYVSFEGVELWGWQGSLF